MPLKLKPPVTPYIVSQAFGVNGQYYRDHGINIAGHNGLDLQASHGQPVYAAHDGYAYYEVDASQGHGVIVRSKDTYTYEDKEVNFKTIYWHLCDGAKEPQFKSPIFDATNLDGPGVAVKAGDLIGYADSTGFSTGDHLHFGLKAIMWGGYWLNLYQDNGYLGALDPAPYVTENLASDRVALLVQQYEAQGNTKTALILKAVVALLKSFGN